MNTNATGRLFLLAIVIDHLRPIRVPLMVVLIGAGAALAVDQISELFLIMAQRGSPRLAFAALLAACAAASIAIWYQGRNAFRLRYPRWPSLQDPRGAVLRAWLPRVLAASVPLLVAAGCWIAVHDVRSDTDLDISPIRLALLVGLSLLLILGFVGRRRLFNALFARLGMRPLARSPREEASGSGVRSLGRVPILVLIGVAVLNVLVTLLVVWFPELLDGLGPLAILLTGGAFFAITGGFATMLCDRRGFPLLTVLAVVAVGLHSLRLNDNHLVRLTEAMSTHAVDESALADDRSHLSSFEAYRDLWMAERCPGEGPCPMLLVSSEGGGIRAAAWTALVLGRLDAAGEDRVIDRAFAMSGVSGGSVGVATVAALHRRREAGMVLAEVASDFLTRDFLAPTLANMLFVDFSQRLLPGAWFDDRGRALTRSWEWNFAAEFDGSGDNAFAAPLAAPYGSIERPDARSPALFLNSTVVQTGERMVQHPFARLPKGGNWFAARDIADFPTARLPLGEAVLNSARFTYVSPAGTLVDDAGEPALQLVDGGYFENSGATTLLDVIDALRAWDRDNRLRLRVLHISNDPSIQPFSHESPGADDRCPDQPKPKVELSGEVAAPLVGLLSTREARGAYARQALLAALGPEDRFWHFRLCPGDYLLPLGWTISAPVITEMERQLGRRYRLDEVAGSIVEMPTAADEGVSAEDVTER